MSPSESLRERNRRRWQRRRRRQVLALVLLVPLLVGAAVLGSRVGDVVGSNSLAAEEVEASPAIARRTLAPSKPLNSNHDHASVPLMVPVSQNYSIHDSDMRTAVGKASTYARYYEPKSHISPRVRWELARLKKLAAQPRTQMIVLPNRGLKPSRLAAVDSVFQPARIESAPSDAGSDYWELERFYVELGPGHEPVLVVASQVPEPGTGSMVCLGLTGLAALRRSKRLRARAA